MRASDREHPECFRRYVSRLACGSFLKPFDARDAVSAGLNRRHRVLNGGLR